MIRTQPKQPCRTWANSYPCVQDKQHPCLSPALSLWSLQGTGSPDLFSSVLKATHSFRYVLMERMAEKSSSVEPISKLLLGRQRGREYWPIPGIFQYYLNENQSGLLKWLSGDGMAAPHGFSYYYNEVFTVRNSPTSFHTVITRVGINKMYHCKELKKKQLWNIFTVRIFANADRTESLFCLSDVMALSSTLLRWAIYSSSTI